MSDRHEKWVRVEPGTVIPAGQPYAVKPGASMMTACTWMEYSEGARHPTTAQGNYEWFVDSSWRPPLVLPTEPTWGIAVWKRSSEDFTHVDLGRWNRLFGDDHIYRSHRNGLDTRRDTIDLDVLLLWLPLTEEQVQRIENAR